MIESVETYQELLDKTDAEQGQQIYCIETSSTYIYNDNQWYKMNASGNIDMNLYDINKQIVSQMDVLSEIELKEKESEINEMMFNSEHNFFMLLNRDEYYFTIFANSHIFQNKNSLYEATPNETDFLLCLQDIADKIYAIDITAKQEFAEIWIDHKGETQCMYLFPYDAGMILYNGGK